MSLSRRRTRGGLVKGASCSGYYKGGSKARRSVSKGGKRKTRKGSGHCTTHNGGKRKTRKGSGHCTTHNGGKRKTRKGSGHCTTHNGGKRKTRKGSGHCFTKNKKNNKNNNKKGGFVRSGSVQHFVTGNCSLNI